uniref:F-box domain-containing protein n=1 Tax=Ceratitis capitata TaxID=7213 RepID=W8BJB7_CERCA
MSKLLDLNDDCLYSICTCLDLNDLLSLKKSCRRMETIVLYLWRHRYRRLSLTRNQMGSFTDKSIFVDLMSSVCDILEELTIASIDSSQIKWIAHLRFHKLHYLECNINHNFNESCDGNTLLLTKMCAYITKLTLLSSTTGKYIKDFNHLIDLDLSCCNYLDTEYIAEICSSLKLQKIAILYYGYNTVIEMSAITNCRTLEELKIDDHHLMLFIDGILSLPHLRKISCYTRDYGVYLVDKIALTRGPSIHTMIFNSVLWSNDRHIQNLIQMSYLKYLILVDDDVEDEQLMKLSQQLTQLLEFHCINSRLESDDGILEIIKRCEKLEVLNLTKSNISADFLKSLQCVENQIERVVPLKLYCGQTSIEDKPLIEVINYSIYFLYLHYAI